MNDLTLCGMVVITFIPNRLNPSLATAVVERPNVGVTVQKIVDRDGNITNVYNCACDKAVH